MYCLVMVSKSKMYQKWLMTFQSFQWISIQALLSAPNPEDPLSENIAKHWKANETEAVETGNVTKYSATSEASDFLEMIFKFCLSLIGVFGIFQQRNGPDYMQLVHDDWSLFLFMFLLINIFLQSLC